MVSVEDKHRISVMENKHIFISPKEASVDISFVFFFFQHVLSLDRVGLMVVTPQSPGIVK